MTDITVEQMETEIINKVCFLIDEFKKHYEGKTTHDIMYPVIDFNLTGTCAGMCRTDFNTNEHNISFNKEMMKENFNHFFEVTVTHEVSHFCSDILWGIEYSSNGRIIHHGKNWKSFMRFFGIADPKTYHNYSVSGITKTLKQRKFLYTCDCMKHTISTYIHNKIQKKGLKYHCNSCKTEITFVEEIK